MDYLLLIVGWGGYLGLHSLLASNPVKAFFELTLGLGVQLYRLLYSLISSIGLLFLFFLMAITPSNPIFTAGTGVRYIGMVIAVWGVILLVASFRKLSGSAFFGFSKVTKGKLVREGIHGKIRHPIYAGTILIFLGMFLYTPTDMVLTSVLVIYVYLPIGIYFEEQKLLKEFGEDYRTYKKEVPALIPGLI